MVSKTFVFKIVYLSAYLCICSSHKGIFFFRLFVLRISHDCSCKSLIVRRPRHRMQLVVVVFVFLCSFTFAFVFFRCNCYIITTLFKKRQEYFHRLRPSTLLNCIPISNLIHKNYMYGMRFQTIWYVRPTKAQTSLRIGAD